MGTSAFSTQNLLGAVLSAQSAISMVRTDFDAVINVAVQHAHTSTRSEGAALEVVAENELVYRAAAGSAVESLGTRVPRTESLSGLCAEKNEALKSDDTLNDDRVNMQACWRVGVRSMIVAPVRHGGKVVAVLKTLSTRPLNYREDDMQALKIIAGMIEAEITGTTELQILQKQL